MTSIRKSVPTQDEIEARKPPATTHRNKTVEVNEISPLEEEILSVLTGNERYGLEICQAFEEASNGRRHLSVGTLYPALARLEKKGLITSRMAARPSDSHGGAQRKYFQITRRGSQALAEAERFRETFRKQLVEWRPAQA